MEQDGRLSVAIVTDDKSRGIRTLESIYRMECWNFTMRLDKERGILYSGDAVYRIIPSNEIPKWKGARADQVILDRVGINTEVANYILAFSCVPENYKIIDDRDVLY